MSSPRTRMLLAAVATAAALTASPAIASAKDFCVGGPAGCTGTPVAVGGLASALTTAQSNGTADRFFLAPGAFSAGNFAYQSAEQLQLIGAGAGKTILSGNHAGPVLTLGGNQASSVSQLTVKPTGAASGGLALRGTGAHGVAVDAKGIASLINGVELADGATFDHGSVDLGTLPSPAVVVTNGAGTLTDTTVNALSGSGLASEGSEATLRRSTVRAIQGVVVTHGHATLSDTLVDIRGNGGGALVAGVFTFPNPGSNATVTTDADRLTIVGSTPQKGTTMGIVADAETAGLSAAVHVRDSVISGVTMPLARQATSGATTNITTSRSAYPDVVGRLDGGPGSIVEQGRLGVSPRFVDVAGGDFHLAPGSPLIDAGTPNSVPDAATDRDGLPRASDGNGDCTRLSDIGAFEFQGSVKAVGAAAATSAATGQPVAFSATGSCIPGPGAPGFAWSFDDGASAAGANVTHAFQTPGHHTATVTVSDGHGHQASATAAIDVAAPTGTPATPAAGPRIAGLRVASPRVRIGRALPKLVRGRVKAPLAAIRFRLDRRATVTLRFARLGAHGAARTLKPAVKIRARKGRNTVRFAARLSRTRTLTPGRYRITAVATDAAGARSARVGTRFTAIAR